MKCEITKDGKSLVITLPLAETAELSSTGKTCSLAGTGGFKDAGLSVGSFPVRVSVNASISKEAAGKTLVGKS